MASKARAALRTAASLLAAVAFPVLIVGGVYLLSIRRFVSGWAERFPAYGGFAAIPAADLSAGPAEEDDEPVSGTRLAKLRFPDGSWVAVAEHDRSTGGFAFDQAVFYDSAGALRKTSRRMGDWGDFSESLRRFARPARTLDDFYVNAAALGLITLEPPAGSAPPGRDTGAAPAGASSGH